VLYREVGKDYGKRHGSQKRNEEAKEKEGLILFNKKWGSFFKPPIFFLPVS
jgi:hypothetical protein